MLEKLKKSFKDISFNTATYDSEMFLVTPSDYELKIITNVKNRYFKLVFQKTIFFANKAGYSELKELPLSKHKKIKVNKIYFKIINTNLNNIIKQENENCSKHNIKIMSYNVEDVYFDRENTESKLWKIHITVRGHYLRT